jgi:hypothetical protein
VGGQELAILEAVQSLATANPEAFGKLVVEILCKLAELDRDAYEYLIGGMISRELCAAGLQVALEQAKQALSLGNTGRVEERISAIEDWLRAVETLGSRERFELLLAEEQETRPTSSHTYVM